MNVDPQAVIEELTDRIKALTYETAVQSAAIKALQAQGPQVVDSPPEG